MAVLMVVVGGIVALTGSVLPWYRPTYHVGGVDHAALLVIDGLDTTYGKIVLGLAVVALSSGLLTPRARGREPRLAAGVALLAGLTTSVIGAIALWSGRSQFVDRATRGLVPAARAIERAVAKRQFDSGGLTIQVRSGVIIVLIGGIFAVLGAVAGIMAHDARPSPTA